LIDLKKLQDEIENEETNLLQNLFQNKSILFRKFSNDNQHEDDRYEDDQYEDNQYEEGQLEDDQYKVQTDKKK
jgi:hypothetical protein